MTEVYSINLNFPSGINESQLKNEILSNASINIACIDVGRVGNVVNIVFTSAISTSQKTILNSIVSKHIPVPVPMNADLYISDNLIKSNISNTTFTFLGNQPNEVIFLKHHKLTIQPLKLLY